MCQVSESDCPCRVEALGRIEEDCWDHFDLSLSLPWSLVVKGVSTGVVRVLDVDGCCAVVMLEKPWVRI